MKTITMPKPVVYLMMGFFLFLAFVVLTGAIAEHDVGRYRMAVITRNSITDVYVIDTSSGVVKYVGRDEGKPFAQMKGQ